MSVNVHPTKGDGWWQIKYYPNGKVGGLKVVVFKGTKQEAIDRERVLRSSYEYLKNVDDKRVLSALSPTKGGSPYVYFIQQGMTGPIKIGYSASPANRLRELQSANPHRLRIIGLIRRSNTQFESEMHEKFCGLRMEGEWFKPHSVLINFIRKYARNDTQSQIAMIRNMVHDIISKNDSVTIESISEQIFPPEVA